MSKENRHIPKYIKDAPWYNSNQESESDDLLAHHRNADSQLVNSGMPKVGTGILDEFTEASISILEDQHVRKIKNAGQPLESRDNLKVIRKNATSYDMKRDRWYGYDPKSYITHLKETEKSKDVLEKQTEPIGVDPDEEAELKELGLWDLFKTDKFLFTKDQTKLVRLREDKALYLKNISDEAEITYDPKSRTNRDETVGYFNDRNLFVRHLTGDAKLYQQSFAWDDTKRNTKLSGTNLTSNPTLSEITKAPTKFVLDKKLFSRYTEKSDKDEDEEEPNRGRTVTHDSFNSELRTYQEDVFIGNHTSIWGSYYDSGRWGFKCCRKLDKNSICD